jgi:NAD(P)-dependent dehydrogenase (short-subunit alcohol dehydrogenase family)
MSRRLQGQVAWVSGAASGIGAAVARLFAAEGARVALADVQTVAGKRVEDQITAGGGTAAFLPCDVGREEQVSEAIAQAAARFGGLQIVVNCAGIVQVGPLHELDAGQWDHLMGVNLKSVFFSLKHAWPHLRANPRSYMVNIGSISSFVGQARTPAYTASKFAVLGLSRSIALDYAAAGLRCNCVCPGITDTPMLREHLDKTGDAEATLAKRLRRVPLGNALQPLDIARAVLYLSCEDSAGVTGTSLVVDGGYLAAAEWEYDPNKAGKNP